VRGFRSDGQLDYVADPNGNRISCAYAAGRLTGLSHSSGESLALSYHSTGQIAELLDAHGRRTRFAYQGEHLVTVTAYDDRVTSYAYKLGQAPATEHALAGIALPDGTRRFFDYDSRGRLSSTYRDGNAETVAFDHDTIGRVSLSDALGHSTRYFLDHAGRVVKIENPLGHAVQFAFDDLGRLANAIDPAGLATAFEYDRRGNLIRSTDALRNVTRFTYTTTQNRLASLIDARGNRTIYENDPNGNLEAIVYSDGSRERWAHDDSGNASAWTNRRGAAIAYERDAGGISLNVVSTPTRSGVDGGVVVEASVGSGSLGVKYGLSSAGRSSEVSGGIGPVSGGYSVSDADGLSPSAGAAKGFGAGVFGGVEGGYTYAWCAPTKDPLDPPRIERRPHG
jgi:YD repeat-containing protein